MSQHDMTATPSIRAAVMLSMCMVAGVASADYEVSRIGGVITAGDDVIGLRCPKGSAIVGFRFKAGTYVDRIQLKCAARLGRTTLGSATDGPGTVGLINPAELFVPGVSSREKTVFCPQHYVVRNFSAKSGYWLDTLQTFCRPQ